MRITILNQFYTPDISPTAHLCDSLANHLARQGHEVRVVASRGGYVPESGDAHDDSTDNPRVHRVWTARTGKATIFKRCLDYASFYVLAFWRVLTLPAQDVIVSLTTPPYIAWAAVAHSWMHRRTRIVLWNMDCFPDSPEAMGVLKRNGWMARSQRAQNRALFKRLDHLVCLDRAMVRLLDTQYTPKDGSLPITIIPNWENAAFFPPECNPAPWDEAEGLGLTGKFVVLYLGNTGYGHRFETVADAAEKLKGEPVVFLFVGGGSRWGEIERAKRERGLDNIVLRGYVPKEATPSVMGCADCALITLRDEALGIMSPSKLHSNLAMRLPVIYIGPPTSNVDDAIERFGCGISVRHGDSDAVVAYVREMMSSAERRKEMRGKARRAFDEAYCDERTLPQFDGVIGSLHARASAAPTHATAADSHEGRAPEAAP